MTSYSELASFFVIVAVNLFLIGTPISVGIFIILRLTRAAPPRARYLLTLTAFLTAAVLPFVVTLALTPERQRHTIFENSKTDSAMSPHGPATMAFQAREIETFPQPQRSATSINILNFLVHFLSRPSLSIALFTVWLFGACMLLGREAASHLRVARARRRWIPASPNIRERLSWPKEISLFVDNQFGPCALGVFNSVVVIPARMFDELSGSGAQQIAHHELNHLKWRDPLVHAVVRIVCASLWPSVPLWYLARATCLEREAASDRAAVNSIAERLKPEIAALEYASTLISIAKRCARVDGRRSHAWVATDVGNQSGLNDRVRRLMAVPPRLSGGRLSLAFITLLVSASFLVILPVARLESKRYENTDAQLEKQQSALNISTRGEAEPAKDQSKKPAGVSGVSSRALGAAQYGPPSTSFPTRPDGIVEEASSPTPTPTAPTTITSANRIPHVTDLQLQILKNQMAALGYTDLTPKQLEEMRAYAVGPAYVAEMAESGYSGLSADVLIRFKWLAVNRSYIEELRTLGYDNLSPQTMIRFREYAVSPDYIRQMRSRISGSISGEQIASLRFFGASIEFVDKLKQMGYASLTADQLISMRIQGVSIEFIQDLQAQGRTGLTADRLIAIRMRISN